MRQKLTRNHVEVLNCKIDFVGIVVSTYVLIILLSFAAFESAGEKSMSIPVNSEKVAKSFRVL